MTSHEPVSIETPSPPADQQSKNFTGVLTSALLEKETTAVTYDEKKFNELYKNLVENNDKMKVEVKGKLFGTNKVPIIIKPTDLLGKTALYNLFLIIQNTASRNHDSVIVSQRTSHQYPISSKYPGNGKSKYPVRTAITPLTIKLRNIPTLPCTHLLESL